MVHLGHGVCPGNVCRSVGCEDWMCWCVGKSFDFYCSKRWAADIARPSYLQIEVVTVCVSVTTFYLKPSPPLADRMVFWFCSPPSAAHSLVFDSVSKCWTSEGLLLCLSFQLILYCLVAKDMSSESGCLGSVATNFGDLDGAVCFLWACAPWVYVAGQVRIVTVPFPWPGWGLNNSSQFMSSE